MSHKTGSLGLNRRFDNYKVILYVHWILQFMLG